MRILRLLRDKAELIRELFRSSTSRRGPRLFRIFVENRRQGSPTNISPNIEQGGLGLPNESYYRESKHDGIRTAYVTHIGKMLSLAKIPNPQQVALK